MQPTDDAAVYPTHVPEYAESHNYSPEDAEKVSLNLEPSGTDTEPELAHDHSAEIPVLTIDIQPNEAIANKSAVESDTSV